MKKHRINPNVLILLFVFSCSASTLSAVPYIGYDSITVRQNSIINYQNVAKKSSGKKLQIRYLKRVKVKLMNGRNVRGNFLKIENDHLYLLDNNIEKIDLDHIPEEALTVIPLTQVDTISRSFKKPNAFKMLGLVTLFMGLIFMLSITGSRDKITVAQGFTRLAIFTTFIGLSLIAFIINTVRVFRKNLRIKGNPARYKPRKAKRFSPYKKE